MQEGNKSGLPLVSPDILQNPEFAVMVPQRDRDYITRGLHALTEHLLPVETLPKGFIGPETSSRPLLHAALPVIRRLYELKGQTMPGIALLQTPSTDLLAHEKEIQAQAIGDIREENVFIRQHKQREAQGKLDAIQSMRDIVDERVKEIVAANKVEAGDSILVIDDYITKRQATLSEIRKGFQRTGNGDVGITGFGFLSDYSPEKAAQLGLIVGTEFYLGHGSTIGFLFRHDGSSTIGYEKGPKGLYATKTKDANEQKMLTLRQGMTALGNAFVAQHPQLAQDRA